MSFLITKSAPGSPHPPRLRPSVDVINFSMPDQHITRHLIDVVAGVCVLVELVLLDDELVADHAAVVDDHVRHRLDAAVHDDEVAVRRPRQRRPTRLVQRPSQQTRLRGLHEIYAKYFGPFSHISTFLYGCRPTHLPPDPVVLVHERQLGLPSGPLQPSEVIGASKLLEHRALKGVALQFSVFNSFIIY